MRKISKIAFVGIVFLAIMVAAPSMVGVAQSFLSNNNINENVENIQEENPDGNYIDQNKEVEEGAEETISEKESEESEEEFEEEINDKVEDNSEEFDSRKKVFLTFDDGPSSLTPEVLEILENNNVKATFFTIGKSVEQKPELVKQTYDEGHMVLPHTYSHKYSIYSSFESYYKDLELAEQAIEDVLDFKIPKILRFPGGSSNHSSFEYGGKQFMPQLTKDIKNKGYYYIDWNVLSGDASFDYDKKDKLISNVINGAKNKDFIVILFHDTARNTAMAEALPEIISELKNQEYAFRTFRDITEEELDKMVELKLANKPIIR